MARHLVPPRWWKIEAPSKWHSLFGCSLYFIWHCWGWLQWPPSLHDKLPVTGAFIIYQRATFPLVKAHVSLPQRTSLIPHTKNAGITKDRLLDRCSQHRDQKLNAISATPSRPNHITQINNHLIALMSQIKGTSGRAKHSLHRGNIYRWSVHLGLLHGVDAEYDCG